ncbi:MAG: 50S ribosomal protein L6 [Candidatus Micrarchaeota archaeon]|nr:50S ribosomal protein L6 [Candidatus Micrarchaeota archaeon]
MKIPEGTKISAAGSSVTVSGAKGTLVRDFSHPDVQISVKGGEIEVAGPLVMVNTVAAHIRNMAVGVTNGYSKKVKILFSHFPITVEIKGREMFVKNFLGEKQPRRLRIMGDVKVEAKGQEVTISGISKDDVGQTFANIKSATKIRNRDSRVFQDGFYEVAE